MKDSEKRQFKRGPLQLPVSFTLHEITREGYLTNLSAGGCLLFCYALVPVKVKEVIEITLNLKNSPDDLRLKGQVVRVAPFVYNPDYGNKTDINYALGLEFFQVTEEQQRVIEEFTAKTIEKMKQV